MAASTPLETQGAAFRFGEGGLPVAGKIEHADGSDVNSPMTAELEMGLSVSLDETGSNSGSSFFAAAPVGRNGFTSGLPGDGGGLFGFGKSAVYGGKKTFGTGLLFGNAGGTNQPIHASQSYISARNGASTDTVDEPLFTPVNWRPPSFTPNIPLQNGTNGIDPGYGGQHEQHGRPPPAVKRNRNQVDIDDSIPSFQFRTGTNNHVPVRTNGYHARPALNGVNGGNEEGDMLEHEMEGYKQKAQLLAGGGTPPGGEGDDPSLAVSAQLRVPRKNSTAARRSTRINGTIANGNANASSVALDSKKASTHFHSMRTARVPSNPRERKRSKAGPSNLDDISVTASSVDSASRTRAGSSPKVLLTSSSPPSTVASHFDPLPPPASVKSEATAEPSQLLSSSSNHKQRIGSEALASQVQPSYRLQLEAAQKGLAENWLRNIYLGFGKAVSSLSRYECTATIKAVLELPSEQRRCSRAVLLLARAHFESLNYEKVR